MPDSFFPPPLIISCGYEDFRRVYEDENIELVHICMPLSIPKHGYYKQKICSTLSAHPRYVFCKAKKIV